MIKISKYKKSILTGIGFLFFAALCNAQDSTAIILLLQEKEYARAKESADRLVAEKETAGNYMLKAVVYDSVVKSPLSSSLLADGRWQSFLALQKAVSFKNEYVLKQAQELAKDLYNGLATEGMINFNTAVERNDKRLFETALSIFKKAAQINQFQYEQKWADVELNSLLLSYLSKAAIYADKESDALFYSKKIVDSNTSTQAELKDNEVAYKWLLYYYSNRTDGAAFIKYLELAKARYPASNYFLLAEIDWLRQQRRYDTLFTRYDELVAKEPLNLRYKMAYCNDIFNSLWPKPAGAGKTAEQLVVELKPLTVKKETATAASLLLAKTYSNIARQALAAQKKNSQAKTYLQLSNNYLQKIISNKANVNVPERKEAKLLYTTNAKALVSIGGY